MDLKFEEKYHTIEKEMWWFRSRRNMIISLLGKRKDIKILDIGCSGGVMLEELAMSGFPKENLYGIDISEKAIEKCKARGFKNCFALDGGNITIPEGNFDVIISSDCLEHIENDEEALLNWFKLLKPGGKAIIYVPAFMFLWSGHDVINHHFRRYTGSELTEKMKIAGFVIEKSGYWNSMLFLPATILRSAKRVIFGMNNVKSGDDLQSTSKFLNKVLTNLLFLENKVHKHISVPFGISTYAIGRKK